MLLYFLSAINFLTNEEKKSYQTRFLTLEEINNQLKNISLEKKYHQIESKKYLITLPFKYSKWDLSSILLGNTKDIELMLKVLPDKPIQELSISYNQFLIKKSFSEIFQYIFSKDSLVKFSKTTAEGDFLIVSQIAPYLYKVHQKVNIFNNNLQITEELSKPSENSFLTTYALQPYKHIQNTFIQSVDPSKKYFQTGDFVRIDSENFSSCLFFKGVCIGTLKYINKLESGILAQIEEICPHLTENMLDFNFTRVGTRQEYCSPDCLKIHTTKTTTEGPFKTKLYTEKIPVDYGTEVLLKTNLDTYEEENNENKYFASIAIDEYEDKLQKLYIDPPPLIIENPFGITPSIVEESLELLNRVN